MRSMIDSSAFTATDKRVTTSKINPESAFVAVRVLDHYDGLEAYLAFDEGGLVAVPQALEASVDVHQRQWL